MKFPANIKEVAKLRPDYLGFIFYNGSPRFFNSEIYGIDEKIKKTGVFVNATISNISETARIHNLQAIQLHGDETPEYCAALRSEFNSGKMEILKAFSVSEDLSFESLKAYETEVDYFLFDTSGNTRGGTGKTFNWDLLLNYTGSTPFFLSGGIGMEEIEKLESFQKKLEEKGLLKFLYGIDVNSRFEISPGLKEVSSLAEFRKQLNQVIQKH